MQSLYKILVVPEGDRYNNSEDDLILNTKIEIKDYSYVNRVGVVVEVPVYNVYDLKKGDRVLVHHNTFRKYYGMSTKLRTSSADLDDGTFGVDPDMLFAYDRGDGWVMINENVLVEPIEAPEQDLILDLDVFIKKRGKLLRGSVAGAEVGDIVLFKPHREYEFRFDSMKVYKMRASDIVGKEI